MADNNRPPNQAATTRPGTTTKVAGAQTTELGGTTTAVAGVKEVPAYRRGVLRRPTDGTVDPAFPLPLDAEVRRVLGRGDKVTTGAAPGEDPDGLIRVRALRRSFTSQGEVLSKGDVGMIPARDFNSTVFERVVERPALYGAPRGGEPDEE